MAGLTNKIEPGDDLDATEVQANFDDLATMANDTKAWMVCRGSVDTRHLSGTWREVGAETDAISVGTGLTSWTKVVPSGTVSWTMTTGQAVLAVAEVLVGEVGSPAASAEARVQIYVGGIAIASTIRNFTLQADEKRAIQIAHLFEGGASTQLVELYVQEVAGSVDFSSAQIIVTRVHR